jgi:hypothetical protein
MRRIALGTRAFAGSSAAAILLVVAGACEGPTSVRPAGITLLAGAAQNDSVEAFLAQSLVVEVRDEAGKPRSGVAVRFEADVVTLGGVQQPGAYLSGPSADDYQPVAEAMTDADGHAVMRVRLGGVVGPTTVMITVPTQGFSTSTELGVRPGAPARTIVTPQDTAVYVGGSYPLRVATEDRLGNRLDVPVSLASDAPEIATAGASVTGQAIGRTRVMVTTAAGQTPAYVSVVPRGTLAANYGPDAYVFELDGSGYHRFYPFLNATVRDVRWITGGGGVWLEDGSVYVYTPSSGGRWLATSFRGVETRSPRASRDGQWVFYVGLRRDDYYLIEHVAARVRVDGTGYQAIGGEDMLVPSPSPTGDRVVYMSADGYVGLRNIEAWTGWNLPGGWPEWSHGDSIAYIHAGSIHLVSSAGEGKRQVGDGTSYHGSLDWSPDDEWIVAHDYLARRLEIIRVATGERIPLPYARDMDSPSWRP